MAPGRADELASSQISAILAELLALPKQNVVVRPPSAIGADDGVDFAASAAGHTFLVQHVRSSSAGAIAHHGRDLLRAAQELRGQAIPLVAVSFMSEAGKKACEGVGVSWFDFSGNAHIIGPGVRVIVDGRPNRFPTRGRPANVFAPKSSRIVRWLLMHPTEAFAQRELSQATGVSEGFISRIAARLEKDRYVLRDQEGRVRLHDPGLLLDAWLERYRFDEHTILRGHIAARSGDALARYLSDTLRNAALEHAATGLVAAWQLTQFVAFRTATFFLDGYPSDELVRALGFREDPRGANTWLVVPNDAGVFQGASDQRGIRCVHPVQAYLDLSGHPERSVEAAERIRAEFLSW